MRITDVETLAMSTPWRDLTFVKVHTDEGLTGLGECRLPNRTADLLAYLGSAKQRHIIGSDPYNIEDLVARMFRDDFVRAGVVASCGIGTVEMACWDIIGKAAGLPVYKLLGGAMRPRLKAYANGWYTVERQPAEFHAAARKVVERGYRGLKLDPFGAGWYEMEWAERRLAIEIVAAVRDEVGEDVEIYVEMHGRFSPKQAIQISADLEPFRPGWVEEPVPPDNLAALKKASDMIRVPVATGERLENKWHFRELLDLQAADIIQPDITNSCGLLEGKKIAAMAEVRYMLVAPHNVGGPVSTAAALHLDATLPNFKVQEYFNDFVDSWVKDVATGLPEVDPTDGCFALPNGPGLGITLNEDLIREHPFQERFFNLWDEDWHRRQQAD
ncbi:MAG: mandelate racemase/muconate lactonizing enzyme family protein [Fimbriimonadaceae bacterium]|nr:mandelate racemase/muconate lactonizing enzyme family protein [Fimbriimonadaceae bacterium]